MAYFRNLIVTCFIILMPQLAYAQAGQISIVGQANVAAAPDIATIRIGVTAEAKSAKEAIAKNSANMNDVLSSLKEAGIASKDLQTSNFSVGPLWDRNNNNRNQIIGYQANNTLSVIVRDLNDLGAMIDRVAGDGANSFHGLEFGLSDPSAAQDRALEMAVKEATRKAQLIASAANVELAGIVSITQSAGFARPKAMVMERAVMADATPIEAGEVGISASVTMVYEIAE